MDSALEMGKVSVHVFLSRVSLTCIYRRAKSMCTRAPARRERRRDASARRRDVGFRNGRIGRLVHANAATAAETNANASADAETVAAAADFVPSLFK